MARRRTSVRKPRAEKKEIEYKDTQNSSYEQFSERKSYDIEEMDVREEIEFKNIPKKSKRKKKKTSKASLVLVVFLMMLTTGVIGIVLGKLMAFIF